MEIPPFIYCRGRSDFFTFEVKDPLIYCPGRVRLSGYKIKNLSYKGVGEAVLHPGFDISPHILSWERSKKGYLSEII